jgi:hypothetical protein
MKLLSGLILIGCTSFASAVTIIDDFTTGSYDYITKTTGSHYTNLQSGSMVGGYRMVDSYLFANPIKNALYHIGIDEGYATVEAGSRLTHETTFSYGNEPSGPGFMPVDMNLDFGTDSALRLFFDSNESDLSVVVSFRSTEQNGGAWTSFTQTVSGNQSTPFTEDFAFSKYAGFDFHNVDQIAINFVNQPAGDFSLTKIQTVPEPASTTAFIMGAIALLAKRRRK